MDEVTMTRAIPALLQSSWENRRQNLREICLHGMIDGVKRGLGSGCLIPTPVLHSEGCLYRPQQPTGSQSTDGSQSAFSAFVFARSCLSLGNSSQIYESVPPLNQVVEAYTANFASGSELGS